MFYLRTVASFAAEEFREADASLEDTEFQWILTEVRHKQDTV